MQLNILQAPPFDIIIVKTVKMLYKIEQEPIAAEAQSLSGKKNLSLAVGHKGGKLNNLCLKVAQLGALVDLSIGRGDN